MHHMAVQTRCSRWVLDVKCTEAAEQSNCVIQYCTVWIFAWQTALDAK